MRSRWLAGAMALCAIVGCSAVARAYCLYVPYKQDKPASWKTLPITYRVSDNVTDAKILAAIDAAFKTWGSVTCSKLAFTKGDTFKMCTEAQMSSCAQGTVHYDHGTPYVYVFWFDAAKGFPADATNYATYTRDFGMAENIASGSIGINAFQFKWNADGGDKAQAIFDVQNQLTKLVGNVIGLQDSDKLGTTMSAGAAYGETSRRTLSQDDIDGVAYLYKESTTCPNPPPPGPNGCSGSGPAKYDGGSPPKGDGSSQVTGDGGAIPQGDAAGAVHDGSGSSNLPVAADDGCGCGVARPLVGMLRIAPVAILLIMVGLLWVARRRRHG